MIYIQTTINNSSSSIIDLALNELCYEFRVRDIINILLTSDVSKKVFDKLRLVKREQANDVIIFVFIIMKARYDLKYLTLNLKEGDKVFLKLYYEYVILELANRKLS